MNFKSLLLKHTLVRSVLAFLVLVAIIGLFPIVKPGLDALEYAMLDQRLRMRANGLETSEDVILLALDRYSVEYFQRNPQLGIQTQALPRHWLARVMNYAAERGARGFALDIEMKDNHPGDKELAEVFKKTDVTVNSYLDISLSEHMDQNGVWRDVLNDKNIPGPQNDVAWQNHDITTAFAFHFPVIRHYMALSHFIPGTCVYNVHLLGAQHGNPMITGVLEGIYSHKCLSERRGPVFMALANNSPVYMESAPEDRLLNGAAELCLQAQYDQAYTQYPDFLKRLREMAVPIEFLERPPLKTETLYANCRASVIVQEPFNNAKGLGVSSIKYDSDGFLRLMPVFYKGYEGRYYPLLTVRAAWEALGRPPLKYEKDKIHIGDRVIPLMDGNKVMVNWRNPRSMVMKVYGRYYKEKGFKIKSEMPPQWAWVADFIDFGDSPFEVQKSINKIEPYHANPQLAYGHLYRRVSVGDIIKKIQNPNAADTPSLYRLYGEKDSGEFSFKNKMIVYGDTIKDVHTTPMGDVTWGPEMMATMLDMTLHDTKFVQKGPIWITILGCVMVCAMLTLVILRFSNFSLAMFGCLVAIAAYWVANFTVFYFEALWFDVIWPSLFFLIAMAVPTAYRFGIQDREKRMLANTFGKYVSPQLMEEIVKNPQEAMNALKGRKKELTVLFTDLHGFTNTFEDKDPEDMVTQLNEYFDTMTKIVLKNGGTYDKYMGDALMCFFGAPGDLPDHAERACKAALEMCHALKPLNDRWESEGKPRLQHGVGLSTGPMFVGNFGSEDIKNFTVMGSNVNLGSRLETYSRVANWPIIISEATYMAVKHWAKVRDLGKVTVKGFKEPVQIYALIGVISPEERSKPADDSSVA